MGQITDESYAHRRVMSAGPKWNMIFDDDHFSGAQQYPIAVAMTGPMNLAELKMLVEDLQGFIDTLEGPVEGAIVTEKAGPVPYRIDPNTVPLLQPLPGADTICSLPTSQCQEMKHPGDGDKVVPHYVSEHGGDGALKPLSADPGARMTVEQIRAQSAADWTVPAPALKPGYEELKYEIKDTYEDDRPDAVGGDESAAASGLASANPAYKSGRHKSHK